MNIIELQDNLKNFSQDQLIKEMQMPSGQVPQFLVLGELDRRKKMLAEIESQKAKEPTVAQEAVAAAGMPQQEMSQMARAMAPKSSIAQNDGIKAMAEGGVVKMAPGGSVGMPVEPFPANSPNPRDRGRWMEKYKDTHNLDGSPKSLSPDLAMQGGISSLSADVGDYFPPNMRMQTQDKMAAAVSPDRRVPRMGDPNPLGSALMNEYRANMATASAPAQDSPTPEVFDATVPASSNELVDTSIEDKTITTPNIRGNDGSSEQLELGVDPITDYRSQTESKGYPFDSILASMDDLEQKQPTTENLPKLSVDSIASRLSTEGPETAALRKRKTSNENPTLDVDFADPTMVPDPSFQNPPDIQEKRDITPTSKVGDLLNYLPDPAAALQDAGAGLASLLTAQETEERIPPAKAVAASESNQDIEITPPATTTSGIEDFVEAEKRRPFTPTTVDDDTPKPPSSPRSGGSGMSSLESEIAQMLKDREKSADQDKWMALAQTGLALMASKQPTLGGALGEAGMAGLKDLRRSKSSYQKDKLSLMTLQQRMEQARMTNNRLAAAANRKSDKSGLTGSNIVSLINSAEGDLSRTLADISEAEREMLGASPEEIAAATKPLRQRAAAIQVEISRYRTLLGGGNSDTNTFDATK